MSVEITRDHLDLVTRVVHATRAQSGILRLIEEEELVSEGMVLLWQIALEFDPSKGTGNFEAFAVQRLRWGLIDYGRSTIGRISPETGKPTVGLLATSRQTSLDAELEDADDDPHRRSGIEADPSPPVEDRVCSRDELRRVLVEASKLPPVFRDALLWPMSDDPRPMALMAQHGLKAVNQVSYYRINAKKRVGAAVGRPVEIRVYARAVDRS